MQKTNYYRKLRTLRNLKGKVKDTQVLHYWGILPLISDDPSDGVYLTSLVKSFPLSPGAGLLRQSQNLKLDQVKIKSKDYLSSPQNMI